jgi:2-iminobutanoate/2-iminopropanoate deaminase
MVDSVEVDIERGKSREGLPFSQYVAVGNWIYVSGVIGRSSNTDELTRDDFGQQTRVALHMIERVLHDAGARLSDTMKATIFVTDLEHYSDVNAAFQEVFKAAPPARTCVEVSRLPDAEAQVEIDVIAYRSRS